MSHLSDRGHIDWNLLEIFSGGYFGFGRYGAPVWLIGPGDDVLGRKMPDISLRLLGWHRRGQREMDDLADFYLATGSCKWLGKNAQVHRSWGRLCRFFLALRNEPLSDEAVRQFQGERFGRRDEDLCLIHLLAANPTTKPWPFQGSTSSFLTSTDAYVERYVAQREGHVAIRMQRHRPELVVFYDLTHRRVWEELAGRSFHRTALPSCFEASGNGSRFLMLRHPESVGTTNDYFREAGLRAAEMMRKKRSHTLG